MCDTTPPHLYCVHQICKLNLYIKLCFGKWVKATLPSSNFSLDFQNMQNNLCEAKISIFIDDVASNTEGLQHVVFQKLAKYTN